MGQTSSSTPPPKEDPDLTSSFGTNLQNFKMKTKILSQELIAFIESSLEDGNLQETVSAISSALGGIEKAPLNIAVMGETGAGKSSLINALQGVGDDEEGAAASTGVVHTTTERTPYTYTKFPSVTLWDLPGIGSTAFQPHDYLKKIEFEEYDFFIIVSSGRFKHNDAELAKAIVQMNRSFYFVRTHTDLDLMVVKRSNPRRFNRENTLKQIRHTISSMLKEVTHQEPPVFLVSNFDVSDFDFPKLETTLLRELPSHKRHLFMMSLHSVTETAIARKRDFLRQKIWLEALKAGVWTTIPLGGLVRDKMQKLEETLTLYRSYFGLDEASLENIAKDFNVSVNEIKAHLRSLQLLTKNNDMSFKEKLLKYIEYISCVTGGPLASGLYFRKTYYWQSLFIDTVASDAKSLLNKEEFLSEKPGSCLSDLPEYWETGMEL